MSRIEAGAFSYKNIRPGLVARELTHHRPRREGVVARLRRLVRGGRISTIPNSNIATATSLVYYTPDSRAALKRDPNTVDAGSLRFIVSRRELDAAEKAWLKAMKEVQNATGRQKRKAQDKADTAALKYGELFREYYGDLLEDI